MSAKPKTRHGDSGTIASIRARVGRATFEAGMGLKLIQGRGVNGKMPGRICASMNPIWDRAALPSHRSEQEAQAVGIRPMHVKEVQSKN